MTAAKQAIEPIKDRILVERIDERSDSPIVLTDEAKSIKGKVLKVGPGKRDEYGDIKPVDVEPGDLIYFTSRWNDVGENYEKAGYNWPDNWHMIREEM